MGEFLSVRYCDVRLSLMFSGTADILKRLVNLLGQTGERNSIASIHDLGAECMKAARSDLDISIFSQYFVNLLRPKAKTISQIRKFVPYVGVGLLHKRLDTTLIHLWGELNHLRKVLSTESPRLKQTQNKAVLPTSYDGNERELLVLKDCVFIGG